MKVLCLVLIIFLSFNKLLTESTDEYVKDQYYLRQLSNKNPQYPKRYIPNDYGGEKLSLTFDRSANNDSPLSETEQNAMQKANVDSSNEQKKARNYGDLKAENGQKETEVIGTANTLPLPNVIVNGTEKIDQEKQANDSPKNIKETRRNYNSTEVEKEEIFKKLDTLIANTNGTDLQKELRRIIMSQRRNASDSNINQPVEKQNTFNFTNTQKSAPISNGNTRRNYELPSNTFHNPNSMMYPNNYKIDIDLKMAPLKLDISDLKKFNDVGAPNVPTDWLTNTNTPKNILSDVQNNQLKNSYVPNNQLQNNYNVPLQNSNTPTRRQFSNDQQSLLLNKIEPLSRSNISSISPKCKQFRSNTITRRNFNGPNNDDLETIDGIISKSKYNEATRWVFDITRHSTANNPENPLADIITKYQVYVVPEEVVRKLQNKQEHIPNGMTQSFPTEPNFNNLPTSNELSKNSVYFKPNSLDSQPANGQFQFPMNSNEINANYFNSANNVPTNNGMLPQLPTRGDLMPNIYEGAKEPHMNNNAILPYSQNPSEPRVTEDASQFQWSPPVGQLNQLNNELNLQSNPYLNMQNLPTFRYFTKRDLKTVMPQFDSKRKTRDQYTAAYPDKYFVYNYPPKSTGRYTRQIGRSKPPTMVSLYAKNAIMPSNTVPSTVGTRESDFQKAPTIFEQYMLGMEGNQRQLTYKKAHMNRMKL